MYVYKDICYNYYKIIEKHIKNMIKKNEYNIICLSSLKI